MYENRIIDQSLKQNLNDLPAILVEGANPVGKTRTCSYLANTTYNLDNEATRLFLKGDTEVILKDTPPVLLDEWQLAPELWSFVRHQVDDGLPTGSILFTGSSIKVNARIHSGARRIIRMKLRPYSIEERQMSPNYIRVSKLFSMGKEEKVRGKTEKTITDYLDEIFRSGFPGIRNKGERSRKLLLESYVTNIIEHEFSENGFTMKKSESILTWMKAYAA